MSDPKPHLSWRAHHAPRQASGVIYTATIWHCRWCAGWGPMLLASCDHQHTSRDEALECAKTLQTQLNNDHIKIEITSNLPKD